MYLNALFHWFVCSGQGWARVSMESRYRHLLPSLDWSRSRHPLIFPVSMSIGLDIQEISQSRWVSVSTSKKFSSLDESRSRHPRNFSVSMSLGLDIQEISQSRSRYPINFPVSISLGLDIQKISKSCWVIKQRKAKQKESNQTRYNQSKSIHLLDWVCFLQHQILTFDGWVSPVREKKSRPTNQKTRIISEISMSLDGVSVSTFFTPSRLWDPAFSSLGLVFETQIFQSRSRSRHWDSDICSLGLGLVIETHILSVSVSSLRLGHFQSRSRYWDLACSVSVLVSSLRLRPFQSRSRSRYWDSDIFSLGLGLDDPNLVSLIPACYNVIPQ